MAKDTDKIYKVGVQTLKDALNCVNTQFKKFSDNKYGIEGYIKDYNNNDQSGFEFVAVYLRYEIHRRKDMDGNKIIIESESINPRINLDGTREITLTDAVKEYLKK